MNRREFLHSAAAVTGAAAVRSAAQQQQFPDSPSFRTGNPRWQATYDSALEVLAGNVQSLPRYTSPVLIEGSVYEGIWMECGPQEALVYRRWRPDVARNSHMTFFSLQRPNGQFPANNKRSAIGFGQIQMVVPIAATAWELAQATQDDRLLTIAYSACSRWDEWLMKYRNTRGTGLVEGFCTYDTGNDNSPRWAGMPNSCPQGEARNLPPVPSLPRLCPDLSATVYGGRVALAAMARALGKPGEADRWDEQAHLLKSRILSRLYVAADASFYDLDANNQVVRVRSEIATRVCGEHVVDQPLFDHIWTRQLHRAQGFWPPYPLPSVAIDDPAFVRPIPRNSWGGASQALTALRAIRWFDHYQRSAEFSTMMDHWCAAIQRDGTFRTQIDPLTGDFTRADAPRYSPTALVFLEYTWRLAGITQTQDAIEWNVRPDHPSSTQAVFRLLTDGKKIVELRYNGTGAELFVDGHNIAHIHSGILRLIATPQGKPLALLGISETPQTVHLQIPGRPHSRFSLAPNQRISL